MYKSFKLHEHEIQIHTTDMRKEQDKEKYKPDTTIKDYETIRQRVLAINKNIRIYVFFLKKNSKV